MPSKSFYKIEFSYIFVFFGGGGVWGWWGALNKSDPPKNTLDAGVFSLQETKP